MRPAWVVAATNVPRGRFAEVAADSETVALGRAADMSMATAGVSFTVFDVQRQDGAYPLASFLNGQRHFTHREALSRIGRTRPGGRSLPARGRSAAG